MSAHPFVWSTSGYLSRGGVDRARLVGNVDQAASTITAGSTKRGAATAYYGAATRLAFYDAGRSGSFKIWEDGTNFGYKQGNETVIVGKATDFFRPAFAAAQAAATPTAHTALAARLAVPPLPHPDASNQALGPNLGGADGVHDTVPMQSTTMAGSGGAGGLLLLGGGLLLAVILLKKK